jgi:hypothetical protein
VEAALGRLADQEGLLRDRIGIGAGVGTVRSRALGVEEEVIADRVAEAVRELDLIGPGVDDPVDRVVRQARDQVRGVARDVAHCLPGARAVAWRELVVRIGVVELRRIDRVVVRVARDAAIAIDGDVDHRAGDRRDRVRRVVGDAVAVDEVVQCEDRVREHGRAAAKH